MSPEAPRVLIVDDDAQARLVVVTALRRAGMEPVEATSGEEALNVVKELPIEVVICDLRMPGMSGLEVLRKLRQQAGAMTLPFLLMTGSGVADTVIEALDAGATDFVAKPVRLDELVARVRAHLRTQSAWGEMMQRELQTRASVIAGLGAVASLSDPEAIAVHVVRLLGQRLNPTVCSILTIQASGRLAALATYDGVKHELHKGPQLPTGRSRDLLRKAAAGAWVEQWPDRPFDEADSAFWEVSPSVVARAPVYSGDRMVALLVLGSSPAESAERDERARLLASVIDLAAVLGAVAGTALAEGAEAQGNRSRLRRVLTRREFDIVFQPIVTLADDAMVGWEALTRFHDGTPPDVRFAEAHAAEMGEEYELSVIEAALADSDELPANLLLALNVSPLTLINSSRRLARVLRPSRRPISLELSEHVQIKDYGAVRAAVAADLDGVQIAVDDAGAGYASLRHLLELRPALAKIDMSLVRGVDADSIRQALVSGLAFYATHAHCQLLAEGVETSLERDTLVGLGVDLGQGYLFGRPEPPQTVRRE